ncbi:helix-turn-helix transcriptional regulator [Ruegeria lacuscaerulensis]|uniref:helix-turn-helix transcriptional regulator n=1 Tax=Ruegeria lacuscaerulensis TaxID=55218 RepID=UPI00147CA28A|nr:helix-turn-helix transcriptional regulator [Ruegeria lacuscaerulensis]
MTEVRKRKKREIMPPQREWPPIPLEPTDTEDQDNTIVSRLPGRNGLAGADDIVQWLAQLMNKKSVSYDQLSHLSGVPSRTIKKWFSSDEKSRTIPKLNTIQACFEALGQSLIVSPPSVQIGNGQKFYPIDNFRRQLLEDWLDQSARSRGVSVSALIEDLETNHRRAIENQTKGYRRREL